MLVMSVVSPVTAKSDGASSVGWSFSAVPTQTCFPATTSVPAFVNVDVTAYAPEKFFPLLLTFDPPLFSGIDPDGIVSMEITEPGTTTVGWLVYGSGTFEQTFTLTSSVKTIGKSMSETVTITYGECPVLPPEK